MSGHIPPTGQLGFDALLADADTDNAARAFEKETAHLPGTMAEAVPYYWDLIEQNHAAMLAADEEETRRLHDEARRLARKPNGGKPGIIASDDAPGCVLDRKTAAEPGTPPLWGQSGSFTISVAGVAIRIKMEGMFGIGSGFGFWPGFAAHVIDPDKPFISETGYRSFLGVYAEPVPGMTPETFAAKIVGVFIKQDLRGKLPPILERYRKSCDERRPAAVQG